MAKKKKGIRASTGAQDVEYRALQLKPGSYDAETRSVEAVLSVGSPVQRWGYVEELEISKNAVDLSRVDKGLVQLLDTHNRWSLDAVLGTVKEPKIESGKLIGRFYFADTDEGRKYEGMVSRGELKGVSIGYRILKFETTKAEGEKPEIRRATRWELLEVSLVPVPADPETGVRSEGNINTPENGASANQAKENDMPNRNASGADASNQNGDNGADNGQRGDNANQNASNQDANGSDANRQDAGNQNQNQNGDNNSNDANRQNGDGQNASGNVVTRFTATEAMDFVNQARTFGDTVATRAQKLVQQNDKGDVSIEFARSQILSAAAEAQAQDTGNIRGSSGAQITDDERDKWLRGAENAILQRAGVSSYVRKAAEARGDKIDLDPGEFRGLRMVDLASWALEQDGIRSDSRNPKDIVAAAFTRAAPGQATGMFPILLENTMHKTLQSAFATRDHSWRRFCGTGSVVDFRPHPRYLRGMFGQLDSLLENGEIKKKPIPDGAKELISAATKANIVTLTRQAIVNDDLGAFSNVAVDLGMAAQLSIEVDVYALLAQNSGAGPTMNDTKAMFHADHNNLASSGAAPTVESFDGARVGMAKQKDVANQQFLDIRPHVWLGPLEMGGNVRVLNEAVYDPDTANKLQKPNKVNGMFADIVDSPRLTGTPWFAFADPAIAPAIEVVFLDGIEEPVLDMQDEWGMDGTSWKVVLDYGVGGMNYRSAWKNPGA